MEILIKAILWTYKNTLKDEHEIRLRITLFRDVKYIGLGYTSKIENWDESKEAPFPSHPKYKEIIREIERIKEEAIFEIKLAKKNFVSLTPYELKLKIRKNRIVSTNKILEYYNQVITQLESEDRIGYSNVFIHSRANLSNFLNDCP